MKKMEKKLLYHKNDHISFKHKVPYNKFENFEHNWTLCYKKIQKINVTNKRTESLNCLLHKCRKITKDELVLQGVSSHKP